MHNQLLDGWKRHAWNIQICLALKVLLHQSGQGTGHKTACIVHAQFGHQRAKHASRAWWSIDGGGGRAGGSRGSARGVKGEEDVRGALGTERCLSSKRCIDLCRIQIGEVVCEAGDTAGCIVSRGTESVGGGVGDVGEASSQGAVQGTVLGGKVVWALGGIQSEQLAPLAIVQGAALANANRDWTQVCKGCTGCCSDLSASLGGRGGLDGHGGCEYRLILQEAISREVVGGQAGVATDAAVEALGGTGVTGGVSVQECGEQQN